jgi:hypothetical protein
VIDPYYSSCKKLLFSQEGRCSIQLVNWQNNAALMLDTNRKRNLQL